MEAADERDIAAISEEWELVLRSDARASGNQEDFMVADRLRPHLEGHRAAVVATTLMRIQNGDPNTVRHALAVAAMLHLHELRPAAAELWARIRELADDDTRTSLGAALEDLGIKGVGRWRRR
jgi:hypothetical protein